MAAPRQLSFIVPAYNEEVMLGGTLRALQASVRTTGLPYEIIVVDDASTDSTAAVARAHGAQVLSVKLRCIAAVRNAGARVARGELLVFVDADTLVGAETLAAMLAAIRRGAVGGGARVQMDLHDASRALRGVVEGACRLLFYAGVAGGCFLFAQRAAFDAVGGFDERYFASEEIHFARALRRRGRFAMLSQAVLSSGRKLRLFPGWELAREVLGVVRGGLPAVRRREALGFWYNGRRETVDRRPPLAAQSDMGKR